MRSVTRFWWAKPRALAALVAMGLAACSLGEPEKKQETTPKVDGTSTTAKTRPRFLGAGDACPAPEQATLALPATDSWSGLLTIKDTSPDTPGLWLTPIHVNLTPDGDLMMFGFSHTKGDSSAESLSLTPTFVMKPSLYSDADTIARAQIYGVPYDSDSDSFVCAGHNFTAEGNLVAVGGTHIAKSVKAPNGAFREFGLTYGAIFGPNGWARIPRDFIGGESWYPTLQRLSDGRMIMYSGYFELDAPISGALIVFNRTMQMYDPKNPAEPWSVLSPSSATPQGTEPSNYTWIYELPEPIDANGAKRQLLVVGSGGGAYLMNHVDAFADPAQRFVARSIRPGDDPAASAATTMLLPFFRDTSKLWYRPGSIVIAGGGGNDASPTIDRVDVYDPYIDKWCQWSKPLGIKRRNSTGIHLPDGNILYVNGENFNEPTLPQTIPQIYDPRTGAFTNGKPEILKDTRGYHNVGILVPDGRVFVGGGRPYLVQDAPVERTHGRFYSPYYLGILPPSDRPQIVGIPKDPVMHWDTDYAVDYKNGSITGASLVAIGSMTHATDFNARFIELEVRGGGGDARGQITLHGPASGRIAPPGYYMLFLLRNVRGVNVPSVAQIIRVDGATPLCDGSPLNACGGCRTLTNLPGVTCHDVCGEGKFKCDGPNQTSCSACL